MDIPEEVEETLIDIPVVCNEPENPTDEEAALDVGFDIVEGATGPSDDDKEPDVINGPSEVEVTLEERVPCFGYYDADEGACEECIINTDCAKQTDR